MGWLIIRIDANATLQEKDKPPALATFTRRHALREPKLKTMQELAERGGYEVSLPIGRYKITEWPLTAVAYTSPNRDGIGRSGSQVYRLLCRERRA